MTKKEKKILIENLVMSILLIALFIGISFWIFVKAGLFVFY